MSPEPCPMPVELRFAVDATEAPLAYPVLTYPEPEAADQLEVELSGPGVLATLVLPIADARSWAGELFNAVSVAYREATGDQHALTDFELASLPDADDYDPGPGMVVVDSLIPQHPIRVRAVDHVSLSDGDAAAVKTRSGRSPQVRTPVCWGP